jgi:tetratricopeptide (TPR) repeat protein
MIDGIANYYENYTEDLQEVVDYYSCCIRKNASGTSMPDFQSSINLSRYYRIVKKDIMQAIKCLYQECDQIPILIEIEYLICWNLIESDPEHDIIFRSLEQPHILFCRGGIDYIKGKECSDAEKGSLLTEYARCMVYPGDQKSKIYHEAINYDDIGAMCDLSESIIQAGDHKMYDAAEQYLNAVIERVKFSRAMYLMSRLYALKNDRSQMKKYLLQAIELKNIKAMAALGSYMLGIEGGGSGKMISEKTMTYLSAACDGKNGDACAVLALYYYQRLTFMRDHSMQDFKNMRIYIDQGNALNNIGTHCVAMRFSVLIEKNYDNMMDSFISLLASINLCKNPSVVFTEKWNCTHDIFGEIVKLYESKISECAVLDRTIKQGTLSQPGWFVSLLKNKRTGERMELVDPSQILLLSTLNNLSLFKETILETGTFQEIYHSICANLRNHQAIQYFQNFRNKYSKMISRYNDSVTFGDCIICCEEHRLIPVGCGYKYVKKHTYKDPDVLEHVTCADCLFKIDKCPICRIHILKG